MKFHIQLVAVACAISASLQATEPYIAHFQIQQKIKNSITQLDLKKVQEQLATITVSAPETKELLKYLKTHAKTVRTALRVQLIEESKKSRVWVGVKAVAQTSIGLSLLRYFTDVNNIKDTITQLFSLIKDPSHILRPYYGYTIGMAPVYSCIIMPYDWARITISLLAFSWAYPNAKFTYYGTTLTEQKLATIEHIIKLVKDTQHNYEV